MLMAHGTTCRATVCRAGAEYNQGGGEVSEVKS